MRDENSLNEADAGVLLSQPTVGVGYQVAGALQRLGRRMIGLLPSSAASEALAYTPMQTFVDDWQTVSIPSPVTSTFAAAVLTLEPELSQTGIVSEERFRKLQDLARQIANVRGEIKFIFVVPDRLPLPLMQSLLDFSRATVFTTPTVFGFRDQGLFDQAFEMYQNKPGLLLKPAIPSNVPLVYVGDVAALVVSALGQTACEQQVLAVEPTVQNLAEFQQLFVASFRPEAPLLERLASKLSSDRLGDQLEGAPPPAVANNSLPAPLTIGNVYKYFPTLKTSGPRVFDQLARLSRRKPFLDLVFPPTRSL